jgi:hypothetical protein
MTELGRGPDDWSDPAVQRSSQLKKKLGNKSGGQPLPGKFLGLKSLLEAMVVLGCPRMKVFKLTALRWSAAVQTNCAWRSAHCPLPLSKGERPRPSFPMLRDLVSLMHRFGLRVHLFLMNDICIRGLITVSSFWLLNNQAFNLYMVGTEPETQIHRYDDQCDVSLRTEEDRT